MGIVSASASMKLTVLRRCYAALMGLADLILVHALLQGKVSSVSFKVQKLKAIENNSECHGDWTINVCPQVQEVESLNSRLAKFTQHCKRFSTNSISLPVAVLLWHYVVEMACKLVTRFVVICEYNERFGFREQFGQFHFWCSQSNKISLGENNCVWYKKCNIFVKIKSLLF